MIRVVEDLQVFIAEQPDAQRFREAALREPGDDVATALEDRGREQRRPAAPDT